MQSFRLFEVKKGNPLRKKYILLTPELFNKIFSPQKLRLLHILKDTSYNITALAEKLDRKFESVNRDLKLFENYGLVKLVKDGNFVVPELIGLIKLPMIV